jgi:hypothetical protein
VRGRSGLGTPRGRLYQAEEPAKERAQRQDCTGGSGANGEVKWPAAGPLDHGQDLVTFAFLQLMLAAAEDKKSARETCRTRDQPGTSPTLQRQEPLLSGRAQSACSEPLLWD